MNHRTLCLAAVLLAGAARAAETPLEIDAAQSRVEIGVKATVDSFTGKLERYDAAIVIDPTSAEVRSARFAFHFEDVKTGKADRDEEMRKWEDTAQNPDGVFTLASLAKGEDGGRVAIGTLVFHGRSREITFPVSITHDGGLYAIDGEATLDTRDFGLPVIKKFLLLKVDPSVTVRFHLQGKAAAAAAVPETK